MADRAVGTATSYPVDKQHVGVEDRELARGHWAGAPDSSYIRESTIKYGDPTSGFSAPPAPPPPPPPPPSTEIGAVIVSGATTADVLDTETYSATAPGATASGLSYSWSAVGGSPVPSGSSCTVEWQQDGAGSVTCIVNSSDPNVTDNGQTDTISVTVNP
jgi:hypothetical protein